MTQSPFAVPIQLILWLLPLATPAFAAHAVAPEAIVQTCQEAHADDSPAKRLARCNGGFGDSQRLARIYAQELDLPAEVARGLAEAVASDAAIEGLEHAFHHDVERIQKVESQFIRLVERAPENSAVLAEIQSFYRRWEDQLDSPAPSLLDRVEQAPEPADLALQLVGPDSGSPNPLLADILLAALAARPDEPVLWERAARLVRNAGWQAALFEQAYRVYWEPRAAAPLPEDLPVAQTLAAEWLQSELDNGLAEDAVAAFHTLPALLREPLAAGKVSQAEAQVAGLPLKAKLESLQLRLAAACLVVGDTATARELLAAPALFPGQQKALTRILERFLYPTQEDPYRLLAAVSIPQGGVLDIAISRFAERERYPAWSSKALQILLARQLSWHFNHWQPARDVPPAVAAEGQRLEQAFYALYRAVGEEMREQREAALHAPKGPRGGAPSIVRKRQPG
jgi:hypothetical protein